jgi:hypothetical protein
MGKVTMVALATKEGDKREFPIGEAETLLRMRRSGWELPKDSEYELSNDGTITRRNPQKGR